ncbi:hypothetical protein O181_111496 [Austropuccinia psidii MF-1]|uniref:Uncharacterized protein n=1 Tax=Austropuccinia psidii MF-1 TaxID=1389203 RepID=A0A9Q3K168_9BASI|nr:hypothetical protein [Austropuccinia psidii MF-1]
MRPKGAKGGQPPSPQGQVGPKTQLGPPEPFLVTNSLDPRLAKNAMDTFLAGNPVGPLFWPWTTMDHYFSHGLWQPPEATRSGQSAFPSAYGEFFSFLHTIRTQGCRHGPYMVLYTIMHHFCSAIQ